MTDTVAATAVRIECVIEGRFSLSQAQNFIKRIMFAAGSHWQDHNHNRSRRLRVELVSFVPRKREPAPPRRWHHKIRRTRSGRDLPMPISSGMKTNRSESSSGEIRSYVQLQHQIHDALREQHPEWIDRNGDCPTCESYESRFAELLDIFQSNERKPAA